MVCIELDVGGSGYRNTARCVWLAMTATLLALLNARWALINTNRLLKAADRGSVEARRAQA